MKNAKLLLFIALLLLPVSLFSQYWSSPWKRYVFRTSNLSIAYDKYRQMAFFASGELINITNLDFNNGPALQPEEITFKDQEVIRTMEEIRVITYNDITKTLYIATRNKKLEVWDINHIQTPQKVTTIELSGDAQDMYLYGNYLYLALGNAGLSIFDVSNPSAPVEINTYSTPGEATGIFVYKNYAYVANGDSGLRIIDIHDPQNPYEVGFCYTPGYASKVNVNGTYAYIADGDSGLTIIDISSISTPQIIVTIDSFDGYCSDVFVKDNYSYVAAKSLYAIDISDPINPNISYNYSIDDSIFRVFVTDSFAFIGTRDFGIIAIDLPTDSTGLKETGKYAITRSFIKGLYFNQQDNSLYLADTLYGIRRVNPWHDDTITSCRITGAPNNVFLQGNYAYVADGDSGLRIIDIHNPDSMYEAGFCYLPGYAKDVYVNGQYAYVSASDAGLVIVDISDPTDPVVTGSYDTPGTAEGVFVSGNYAYIADGDSGLRIIDVSNPSLPSEVGYYDTPGYAYKVSVFGDSAYVADGPGGIREISVSNPTYPIETSHFEEGQEAISIFVDYDVFYGKLILAGFKDYVFSGLPDSNQIAFVGQRHSWGIYWFHEDFLQGYPWDIWNLPGSYDAIAEGDMGVEIYFYAVGIKETPDEKSSSKITLDGNIIKNNITLNFQKPLKDWITAAIYSIDGREVKKYLISPEITETGDRIRIPVQEMRNGVYLLRLKGRDIAITRTIEVYH